MTQEDDPVFTRPESYGIEDLEAPGEPNREQQPPSTPVPGTGREARLEHMREHDAEEGKPHAQAFQEETAEFRERKERVEREEARRETEETEADLGS